MFLFFKNIKKSLVLLSVNLKHYQYRKKVFLYKIKKIIKIQYKK